MNPIPPATLDKIATHYPEGTRHKAIMDIVIPLLGNGLPRAAVFATIRAKFDAGVSDREINAEIDWAERHNPTPSGYGRTAKPWVRPEPPKPAKARTPLEQADWWTHGASTTPEEAIRISPVKIPETPVECATLLVSSLYREQDKLNVVCRFFMDGPKTKPHGPGKVLSRDGWVQYFHDNGVPQSEAGAWVRFNPCKDTGSGKQNAMTDADITGFRYALLESDHLCLDKQLALYTRWKLPIAAITLSGGHSAHAWVRIEAETPERYKEITESLLNSLECFSIDQGNKNPSRLSRLAGAKRTIGAENDGQQRLLYLNPNVKGLTLETLKSFQESLDFPQVVAYPLAELVEHAMERYEWMYKNQGKLGIPSGIPKLDYLSGGLKNGQTTVVAGSTGAGKTTMATHIVLSALKYGAAVALFSLEMDKEEIFDLLVSNLCSIDRNKFNSGRFHEDDFGTMSKAFPSIYKMPLYVDDSPLTSANEIRSRVFRLKADANIALVVIDYIQFVNPEWSKDTREQQVAQISHELRSLAREAHLPMVILSQLNDEGRMRESRVIAHNANTVMIIETNGDDFKINIAKGRSIPLGEYHMRFDRIFNRLIPVPDPEQPRSYSDP